jgi:23S rRNA (adenine2503-C2)-methyltransferase
MKTINDLTRAELKEFLTSKGHPAYRATQLCEWLHKHRVKSFDDMTNLPRQLRDHLAKHFSITRVNKKQERVSPEDGATKYLLGLGDGEAVESVFLPHPRGATLCISTQVGCAFRCGFCATGSMGFKRNLSPGEIVDQVNFVNEYLPPIGSEACDAGDAGGVQGVQASEGARAFSNLVIMGMGEPLANYDNLVKALEILIDEVGVGARRITVSTCGLPDKIMKLADVPYEISLAVSVNSPIEERRKEIMPVAARTTLTELMAAARYYFAKKNRMLTFEYVLMAGINDRVRDAHELASLIREIPAKINLIVLNPFPGCRYKPSEPGKVKMFQSILEERGKKVTLRKSLGCDILAGCGQLGARAERKERGQARDDSRKRDRTKAEDRPRTRERTRTREHSKERAKAKKRSRSKPRDRAGTQGQTGTAGRSKTQKTRGRTG